MVSSLGGTIEPFRDELREHRRVGVGDVPSTEDESYGALGGLGAERGPPGRIVEQLGAIPSAKLWVARYVVAVPPAQRLARGEVLPPSFDAEPVGGDSSGPDPVDQVPSPVRGVEGLVGPSDLDRHDRLATP